MSTYRESTRFLIRQMLAGSVAAFLVAGNAHAGDLNLTVTGIRSDSGAVMIGLYDSEERFVNAIAKATSIGLLSDIGRFVGVSMRARKGVEGIGFLQLPPGCYAIVVYHDENDNGLLDTNFFGVPKEGYGFGNNVTGFLGPPSYGAASIRIDSADVFTSISLSY